MPRARAHLLTCLCAWSPLQCGLNLFDLLCLFDLFRWLVDCLACNYYMLCVFIVCSLCMDYSNQIKSNQNRNDCKSTQVYYILELRTFPFLISTSSSSLSPFSIVCLGYFCFCVSCVATTQQYGKQETKHGWTFQQNDDDNNDSEEKMIIAWQITCKRYICTVDSPFYAC